MIASSSWEVATVIRESAPSGTKSCHTYTLPFCFVSGKFEPPGARSVADFVYEYDKIAAELRSEVRKAAVRPLVVEGDVEVCLEVARG